MLSGRISQECSTVALGLHLVGNTMEYRYIVIVTLWTSSLQTPTANKTLLDVRYDTDISISSWYDNNRYLVHQPSWMNHGTLFPTILGPRLAVPVRHSFWSLLFLQGGTQLRRIIGVHYYGKNIRELSISWGMVSLLLFFLVSDGHSMGFSWGTLS